MKCKLSDLLKKQDQLRPVIKFLCWVYVSELQKLLKTIKVLKGIQMSCCARQIAFLCLYTLPLKNLKFVKQIKTPEKVFQFKIEKMLYCVDNMASVASWLHIS